MIKLGNTGIGKIYLGEAEIAKAYLGDDLVYGAGGSGGGGEPEPPVDPYEGWTEGYRLNTTGETTSNASTFSLSPYLPAESESVVTYYVPTSFSTNSGIWVYDNSDSNGSYLGWMSRAVGEHTFTMPSGKTKFRLSYPKADLPNAYIKDSNGNYIWKGGNVT